jgi:hypothetical protein
MGMWVFLGGRGSLCNIVYYVPNASQNIANCLLKPLHQQTHNNTTTANCLKEVLTHETHKNLSAVTPTLQQPTVKYNSSKARDITYGGLTSSLHSLGVDKEMES